MEAHPDSYERQEYNDQDRNATADYTKKPKDRSGNWLTAVNILLLLGLAYVVFTQHQRGNGLQTDIEIVRQEKALLESTLADVQKVLIKLQDDESKLNVKVQNEEKEIQANSQDVKSKINSIVKNVHDVETKGAQANSEQDQALEKFEAAESKVDSKQELTEAQLSQKLDAFITSNKQQIANLLSQINANANQISGANKSANQNAADQQNYDASQDKEIKGNKSVLAQVQKTANDQANLISDLTSQVGALAAASKKAQADAATAQAEAAKAHAAADAATAAAAAASKAAADASAKATALKK